MLVAGGQGVGVETVGEQRAKGMVVDVAAAIVDRARIAQVRLEAPSLAQRQLLDEIQAVLLVDTVQPTVVVARAQVRTPLVAAAGEGEFVAGLGLAQHDVALAAVEHRHFLVIRGVALVDPVQAAEVEAEVVDFVAGQPGAAKGLRQQAAVVAHQHRQQRLQGAELEGALRGAQLGGQALLGVFVLGAIGCFAVGFEQAGAGAVRAGVELQTEQADGVHADTDGAFGITGLQAQDKALGPFLGFVAGGCGVAEIAVEVEIASIQAGLAVVDKGRAGGRAQADGDTGGEQLAGRFTVVGHGAVLLFLLWLQRFWPTAVLAASVGTAPWGASNRLLLAEKERGSKGEPAYSAQTLIGCWRRRADRVAQADACGQEQPRVHQPGVADDRREVHACKDVAFQVDARGDLDQLQAVQGQLEHTAFGDVEHRLPALGGQLPGEGAVFDFGDELAHVAVLDDA
ncbi:hypothetical protein FQZ97_757550 [compost metagenome]